MEEMVMGQERIIHAALLGAGTVGSGVYKLVKDLEEEIVSKTGAWWWIKFWCAIRQKRGKAFRLSF
jgi:homoserine dehydrogenase